MQFIRIRILAAGTVLLAGLTACAPLVSVTPTSETTAMPECVPAAPGDALVGNWLSVNAQQGVAGALRTLYTLNPDGTMSYVEQIKRPRSPSQGLYESGCWSRQDQQLVLRTLLSNDTPVNLDDPIYTNRYLIEKADSAELRLRGAQGPVRAKRMSPGYRLPF